MFFNAQSKVNREGHVGAVINLALVGSIQNFLLCLCHGFFNVCTPSAQGTLVVHLVQRTWHWAHHPETNLQPVNPETERSTRVIIATCGLYHWLQMIGWIWVAGLRLMIGDGLSLGQVEFTRSDIVLMATKMVGRSLHSVQSLTLILNVRACYNE